MFFANNLERGDMRCLSVVCRGREGEQLESVMELDKVRQGDHENTGEEAERHTRPATITSTTDGSMLPVHESQQNLVHAPGTAF